MRLTKIATAGLKGRDHRLDTDAAVVVVVGGNGAGKTQIAQAIALLATGSAPGAQRTGEGIMRLARNGSDVGASIEVKGTFSDGTKAARAWRRAEKTVKGKPTVVVSSSATLTGVAPRDAEGAINARLGGWAESWDPDEEFLGLSPDKLRRRILRLLGVDGSPPPDLLRLVPRADDEELDAYCERARVRADERKSEASRRVIRLEAESSSAVFVARPDLGPLQANLAALHAEMADVAMLVDLDRDIAAAEIVSKARAVDAPPVAGPSLADVQRARDVAEDDLQIKAQNVAVETSRRAIATEAVAKAQRTLAEVEARERRLRADGTRGPVDLYDLDEAGHEAGLRLGNAKTAELLAAALLRESVRADARVGALDVEYPIRRCPACDHDLTNALVVARESAERIQEDAKAAWAVAAKASSEARVVSDLAQETARVARLGSELRELLARKAPAVAAVKRAQTELAEIPPVPDTQAETEAVRRARAAVAAAEQAQRARTAAIEASAKGRAEAEAAKARLVDLRGRREQVPDTRAASVIAAEIVSAQAALEEAGKALGWLESQAARRAELAEARQDYADAAAMVERLKDWSDGLLDRVRGELERPLSEAVGLPVEVQMADARGNATCRILVDGVDVASISTGERLRFLGHLLPVLGRQSKAAWKPVLIDGLESISIEYRGPFLAALVRAVEAGDVHQIFCLGCILPQDVMAGDGVKVIDIAAPAILISDKSGPKDVAV